MEEDYKNIHHRRPALIPADSNLSPEDEQSLRLRIGDIEPPSLGVSYPSLQERGKYEDQLRAEMRDLLTAPNQALSTSRAQPQTRQGSDFGAKRKASTSADQYREVMRKDEEREEGRKKASMDLAEGKEGRVSRSAEPGDKQSSVQYSHATDQTTMQIERSFDGDDAYSGIDPGSRSPRDCGD